MDQTEVLDILDLLQGADVLLCVSGGWGVDALLGRQTREHRDLVHPVTFAIDGSGVQAGLGGASFDYPADCFTRGRLSDHMVACLP